MKTTMKPTEGAWGFACDSYGKVRHSKKACVFTTVKDKGGDRLETVAARISNWSDARLMAAAPRMLAALKAAENLIAAAFAPNADTSPTLEDIRAAIAKATGGEVDWPDRSDAVKQRECRARGEHKP